jgi:hypothetical protein
LPSVGWLLAVVTIGVVSLFEAEQAGYPYSVSSGRLGAWPGTAPQLEQWPNNPDDDGNALAGVLHAVLVEAVVVGLVVLLWWWWVAIVP